VDDNVTKSEFVERLVSARHRWDAAVDRIPPEEALKPGFCGDWSLKDVIAHITWYEREMIEMLDRRDFAGSKLWELPTDERNAVIREQTGGGTLAERLGEARQAFERLIELIDSLTDNDLNDPASFPGMPPEWKPWQVLASNTYEHYEDHLPQAEAFLGRPTGEGGTAA
jgi:uncharacterized damage-inducible protein DinB